MRPVAIASTARPAETLPLGLSGERQQPNAGIAVIVITGAGDLADASAALASGAQACLHKPVDWQQFKQLTH